MNFFDRLKNSWKGLVLGALFGLTGPYLAGAVFQSLAERASFQMIRQRIEWLRQAAAAMPCGLDGLEFQSLIGEVVSWDERIVHEHEANRHWWSDYFSPDAWNDIQTIPLPCSGKDGP